MTDKPVHRSLMMQESSVQLDLIDPDQIPLALTTVADHRNGEHTAAQLFFENPDKYRLIVSLLAEGHGILRVAKLTRSSNSTVSEVRDRETVVIEKERMQIVNDGRRAAKLCIEGVLEDMQDDARRKKVPTRDKAIIAGVLIDKSELLSGGVTHRIQLEQGPSIDDYRSLLQAAADQAVEMCQDAEDTGLTAQTSPPKEADVLAIGPPPGHDLDEYPSAADMQASRVAQEVKSSA